MLSVEHTPFWFALILHQALCTSGKFCIYSSTLCTNSQSENAKSQFQSVLLFLRYFVSAFFPKWLAGRVYSEEIFTKWRRGEGGWKHCCLCRQCFADSSVNVSCDCSFPPREQAPALPHCCSYRWLGRLQHTVYCRFWLRDPAVCVGSSCFPSSLPSTLLAFVLVFLLFLFHFCK